MEHLDEHTIELFVLGSDRIRGERAEIERHLAACPACQSLASRIGEFYAAFQDTLAKEGRAGVPVQIPASSGPRRLRPLYERHAAPVRMSAEGRVAEVFSFVRRHPAATSGGIAALMLGLALVLLVPRSAPPPNPEMCKLNREHDVVEIRDNEGKILWTVPTLLDLDLADDVQLSTFKRSVIVHDLDGDGTNEVVSIIPIGDESYCNTLRIYTAGRELIHEREIIEEFKYLDRFYTPNIDLGSLLVGDVTGTGSPEIWVTGNSHDRSPGVTIRMDMHGNTIGRYWHFGQLREIYSARMGLDRREYVILTGADDAEDSTQGEFPTIVVLDPAKVVGDRRSLRSPGFAFPASDAEMVRVSLPLTDMNREVGLKPSRTVLLDTSSTVFVFRVASRLSDETPDTYEFDYVFDPTLRILEVKSNNHTDAVRERLAKAGLVRGPIDRAYLDALKSSVKVSYGAGWLANRPSAAVNSTH